jgi:hypothetical protein
MREQILQFCDQFLSADQRQAVMAMTDELMATDATDGHNLAGRVVHVIQEKRCRHDRIQQLEDNAEVWKRRALASERQLGDRIKELEQELELFNTLSDTIHGIAKQQLAKQPDPQEPRPLPAPRPIDPDREHVLATLQRAGIKPIEQAIADGDLEDYDDEE